MINRNTAFKVISRLRILRFLILICVVSPFVSLMGQMNNVESFVSLSAITTTNDKVPYWMRSMNYGSIPLDGKSASVEGGFKKKYRTNDYKRFDWGGSMEGRFNYGSISRGYLVEAYLKTRYSIFQIKAGRSKDRMGLADSTLSTGAFSVSGNALGIPKVEFSIPDYWDIPFTNRLFAIKGTFAHGWMGSQNLNSFVTQTPSVKSYLHQKSFYGRFGKPEWKINLFGGINHQVIWGNESEIYESYNALSNKEIYWYVISGKAYGGTDEGGIPRSKIGNHLGSVDQAVEISLKSFVLLAYHQFFYEAGALAYLDNVKDGLFGLSIQNRNKRLSAFYMNKLVVEYFNSKSQGGEVDSKARSSSYEDYYNNFIYAKGWTYEGENIGNPLITPVKYMYNGLPIDSDQYFNNNRVTAFHMGIDFYIQTWRFKILSTWSNNFGTYETAPAHKGFGEDIIYNDPPYFGKQSQYSGFLEITKYLSRHFLIKGQAALDEGKMYNSNGISFSLVYH